MTETDEPVAEYRSRRQSPLFRRVDRMSLTGGVVSVARSEGDIEVAAAIVETIAALREEGRIRCL